MRRERAAFGRGGTRNKQEGPILRGAEGGRGKFISTAGGGKLISTADYNDKNHVMDECFPLS